MKSKSRFVRGSRWLRRAIAGAWLLAPVPGAWSQDPTVDLADPPAADQGTFNLNVTITGSGFEPGADAFFYVAGSKDPGGVVVNSTTYRSPRRLIANIDVTGTAQIKNFDVVVKLDDSRSGKGAELFAVRKGKTTPLYHLTELGAAAPSGWNAAQDVSNLGVVVGTSVTAVVYPDANCQQRAATVWDLSGPGSETSHPPDFVDDLCTYCASGIEAVSPDGSLAAGWRCEGALNGRGCFDCNEEPALWESDGAGGWSRTVLTPVSSPPRPLTGAAVVAGVPMVVGKSVWRKIGSNWVGSALPAALPWRSGNAIDIRSDGLVVGTANDGVYNYSAAWKCDATSCTGPWLLPAPPIFNVYVTDVSEDGDAVAGGNRPLVWRFTGYDGFGNPTWAVPEFLEPLEPGREATAHASAWVDGVLHVVGGATEYKRRNRQSAVRWRHVGGTWGPAEKLELIDDWNRLLGSASGISSSGRIAGTVRDSTGDRTACSLTPVP